LKAVEAAAQGFGITVQVFETRRAADIAEAFYVVDRSRIQGLLLLSSPLIAGNPQLIADLAVRRNLPTISLFPEIARAGGLLGYGPDIQDLFSSDRRDGAQGPARRKSGRVARRAAHAIPTCGEFEDREANRYHAAGVDSAARRRGD